VNGGDDEKTLSIGLFDYDILIFLVIIIVVVLLVVMMMKSKKAKEDKEAEEAAMQAAPAAGITVSKAALEDALVRFRESPPCQERELLGLHQLPQSLPHQRL